MSNSSTSNPEGYHSVTPALTVRDAAKALDFYARVFGATETMRMAMPDGKIVHAEMRIGDSAIMISDEFPDWGSLGPLSVGGNSVTFQIYLPDADAVFQQAIEAGATVLRPLSDQFWGDRTGTVTDPFGHRWMLATRKENVSPQEMERRGAEFMKGMAGH